MGKNKLIAFEDDLAKQAEEKGINFTAVSNKLLREYLKDKNQEELKAENITITCDWCSRQVALKDEPYYLCEMTRKGACESCEFGVKEFQSKAGNANTRFLVKCNIDLGANLVSIPMEHEHKRFGVKFRPDLTLQTLEDLEKNKSPGGVPVKAIEPPTSAPF